MHLKQFCRAGVASSFDIDDTFLVFICGVLIDAIDRYGLVNMVQGISLPWLDQGMLVEFR